MAEFKKLPTQAELQQMLYMGQLQGKSNQDIINENLASNTIKALPENFFTKAGAGARQAGQFVNRAGNAQQILNTLFPSNIGNSQFQVSIPTSFNFSPKMDPSTGQVIPGGLQTQSIPMASILQAIKPADMLGLTGTAKAYEDIGAGKAPSPMDVLDVAGVGALGLGASKGLLKTGIETGKFIAPKVGQMAEQYAVNTGLLSPLVAYHGSPYSFDKFDISKVGTGEGAQAYGHGIYFAEDPKIAKNYKKTTSYQNAVREFTSELPEDADFSEIMDLADSGKLSKSVTNVIKELQNNDWLGFDYPSQAINAAFRNSKNFDMSPELVDAIENYGNLYKVDIPDKQIATFLDWDKKISEQKQVQDAFKKINDKYDFGYADDSTGADFYKGMTVDFIRTGKAKNEAEAQKLVSDELNKLGVQGVKYLDAGSRGKKEGTSNFVVFDPSAVKMLEKNSNPISQEGGLLGKAGQSSSAVPETMYHGTGSDIQAFRPGNTVYVSPSPKFAESYAGTQSPNIMPLRANVANPFNYESAADIQKLAESYKKLHGEDLFSKKTISSASGEMKLSQLDKNPISQRLKSGDWTIIEDKKVQDAIKKAGFDAFYIEEGGVKNLGVYDPTKLKSVFSSGGDVKPAGLLGAQATQQVNLQSLANKAMEELKANPTAANKQKYLDAMAAKEAEFAPTLAQKQAIQEPQGYQGQHTAPLKDSGKPLWDLSDVYPADFYSPQGARYYGHGEDLARDSRIVSQIQSFKGKPDKQITVYRAVPKDIPRGKGINQGDWITTDLQYAKEHGKSALGGDYKIVKKTVSARDIFTNGDSIYEFGYDPQPYIPKSQR